MQSACSDCPASLTGHFTHHLLIWEHVVPGYEQLLHAFWLGISRNVCVGPVLGTMGPKYLRGSSPAWSRESSLLLRHWIHTLQLVWSGKYKLLFICHLLQRWSIKKKLPILSVKLRKNDEAQGRNGSEGLREAEMSLTAPNKAAELCNTPPVSKCQH